MCPPTPTSFYLLGGRPLYPEVREALNLTLPNDDGSGAQTLAKNAKGWEWEKSQERDPASFTGGKATRSIPYPKSLHTNNLAQRCSS